MNMNKYALVDIVTQASLDSQRAKLLDAMYDPFMKMASDPNIADMSDGDVENATGYFAYVDMSGHHRGEVMSAVFEVDDKTVFDIPGNGFYVTQTDSNGLIWCYEYQTSGEATTAFYRLSEAFVSGSDSDPDGDPEPEDLAPEAYVWVRAWGSVMRCRSNYTQSVQGRASAEGVPVTVVTKSSGVWITLEDVKFGPIQKSLMEWATKHEIEVPESALKAWKEE